MCHGRVGRAKWQYVLPIRTADTAVAHESNESTDSDAHFITFGCYKRRHLLSRDQPKRIGLGGLYQELRRLEAQCIGFVVMPNHVHALVWFPRPGCLSRFLHEGKRHSSHWIRAWYGRQQLRYFDDFEVGIRFWQPQYHAFEIGERAKMEEKRDDMHANPVRAGLVARAVDWPWSSARWSLQHKSVGVPMTWVQCDSWKRILKLPAAARHRLRQPGGTQFLIGWLGRSPRRPRSVPNHWGGEDFAPATPP